MTQAPQRPTRQPTRPRAPIVVWTALATLTACSSSTNKPRPGQPLSGPTSSGPTAQLPTLRVAIASLTLADDCAPAVPLAEAKTALGAASQSAREGDSSRMDQDRACEQTTLQLQLTSANPNQASKVNLRTIELLDDTGKVLGELTARAPSRWHDTGKYVVWDQTVAGNETVKASWPLSQPAWEKYGLTRAAAAGRTFRVRVTITTDGNDQVVAGQATVITPRSILNPMMDT